jgi:hypothetical protein
MRFEAFRALKIQVELFWVVIYIIVVGYQRFTDPCCRPENGGNIDLWKFGVIQQHSPEDLDLKDGTCVSWHKEIMAIYELKFCSLSFCAAMEVAESYPIARLPY